MSKFIKDLQDSAEYKVSLSKIERQRGRHLELVNTVTLLSIMEALHKIVAMLDGRPITSAKHIRNEESPEEEETRVDREVTKAKERLKEKQEESEEDDDDDEDKEEMSEEERQAEIERLKGEVARKSADQDNKKKKKLRRRG